jgi:hypothetical protein
MAFLVVYTEESLFSKKNKWTTKNKLVTQQKKVQLIDSQLIEPFFLKLLPKNVFGGFNIRF